MNMLRTYVRNWPMRAKGLFITGTHTGVGKTRVTAIIGALLRKQGIDFGVSKPVHTGVKGRTCPDLEEYKRFFSLSVFQAEDGIRDWSVTGVQTCALPI